MSPKNKLCKAKEATGLEQQWRVVRTFSEDLPVQIYAWRFVTNYVEGQCCTRLLDDVLQTASAQGDASSTMWPSSREQVSVVLRPR